MDDKIATVKGESTPDDNASWFTRNRALVFSGVIAGAMVIGGVAAVRKIGNDPVVSPYVEVVDGFYKTSPKAKQRLDEYYAKHQRTTVAAKHYSKLCYQLKMLAYADGVSATRDGQHYEICPDSLFDDEMP